MSSAEMTTIPALYGTATSLPMPPGQVERNEFEYMRHGSQSLIANWEVATGRLITPAIAAAATRTKADFAAHMAPTWDTDPDAVWLAITDQLNIHQSGT